MNVFVVESIHSAVTGVTRDGRMHLQKANSFALEAKGASRSHPSPRKRFFPGGD